MRDALLMQILDQIEKLDSNFEDIGFTHCVSHFVINVHEWSAQLLHDDEPGHVMNLEMAGVNAVRQASVHQLAEPVKVWDCLKDLELFLEKEKTYAVHEFDDKVSFCLDVILAHDFICFEYLTELADSQALYQPIDFTVLTNHVRNGQTAVID